MVAAIHDHSRSDPRRANTGRYDVGNRRPQERQRRDRLQDLTDNTSCDALVGGNKEEVKFSIRDAEGIETPQEDALVIVPKIANHRVYRVLIDDGSAANIIYLSCLEEMRIQRSELVPSKTVLMGFSGEKSESEWQITLPVTVGDDKILKTVQTEWQVLRAPSPYNAILGRPWLCQMKVVTSIYHQCLKFSSSGRTVVIRSDRLVARQCQAVALGLQPQYHRDSPNPEEFEDQRNGEGVQPVEETEAVDIGSGKTIQIRANLSKEEKAELTAFLKRNRSCYS